MSAVDTSSLKRLDFTWSATRLRAMVVNQAPMSLPCQVNESMRRSARRKVSDVRSSASACEPTR